MFVALMIAVGYDVLPSHTVLTLYSLAESAIEGYESVHIYM